MKYFSHVTQGGMKGTVLRKGSCIIIANLLPGGANADISSLPLIAKLVAVSLTIHRLEKQLMFVQLYKVSKRLPKISSLSGYYMKGTKAAAK